MWDKVIFVCKSGTCRAPMAAALLRECSMKREIEILARGLVVLFPEPLNQKVDAILISNGINMEGYMSEQLVAEDVDEHTLVLVMEEKFLPQAAAILGEDKMSGTCPDSTRRRGIRDHGPVWCTAAVLWTVL